ncbi:MAG: preprotein translocase subunit SecE [Chloroflexi bacterium]|nr:preprotein translocase subunit SecE [Chloroflexota bacterium]
MGREARRAQARQERRQRQQRTQARTRPPSVSAPATSEPARRGSLLRPRWVTEILSELRKVTWPSRNEVFHLTVVVIVVSILIGIVLGVADLVFGWFVERLIVP